MNRTQSATFLSGLPFATFASTLGIPLTDTPDGIGGIIDAAARDIGISEANLAGFNTTDAQTPLYLAYLRLEFWQTASALVALTAERVSVDGATVDRTGRATALAAYLKQAQEAVVSLANSQGGPLVGTLTKTAPLMPESGQPDPNSRRYRGDPLVR